MVYRYIWKITLNEDVREQDFINHWRESSTVLQEYPGALGTHLHRMRNDDRTFFAVAEWESMAARDAMQAETKEGKTDRAKSWQQFMKNHTFGEIDVHLMGEEIGVALPSHQN